MIDENYWYDDNFTKQERCTGVPEKKKLKKYALSILFMLVLIAITLYVIFKDNSADEILQFLRPKCIMDF